MIIIKARRFCFADSVLDRTVYHCSKQNPLGCVDFALKVYFKTSTAPLWRWHSNHLSQSFFVFQEPLTAALNPLSSDQFWGLLNSSVSAKLCKCDVALDRPNHIQPSALLPSSAISAQLGVLTGTLWKASNKFIVGHQFRKERGKDTEKRAKVHMAEGAGKEVTRGELRWQGTQSTILSWS